MRVPDSILTPQGPFQQTGRMLQHTSDSAAAAAWEAGSLGVGFSGTGFLVSCTVIICCNGSCRNDEVSVHSMAAPGRYDGLLAQRAFMLLLSAPCWLPCCLPFFLCCYASAAQVMYFVGVTSVLRSLGILTDETPVAGASGGSVAAAISCSGVQQDSFLALATALNSACAGDSCRGNLENVIKAGLTGVLPGDAHQRCSGRLFVSITEATGSKEADVERKISSFPSRNSLIRALMTSTYIPGFAGASAVTYPAELGVTAAYDGVSTNPLPVPPGT